MDFLHQLCCVTLVTRPNSSIECDATQPPSPMPISDQSPSARRRSARLLPPSRSPRTASTTCSHGDPVCVLRMSAPAACSRCLLTLYAPNTVCSSAIAGCSRCLHVGHHGPSWASLRVLLRHRYLFILTWSLTLTLKSRSRTAAAPESSRTRGCRWQGPGTHARCPRSRYPSEPVRPRR